MSGKALVKRAASDIALPRYDEMCRAIAECHRVDEAKDIRDRAEALRAYSKKASNREAEVQFSEIKLFAERKCGEMLREMAELGQRDSGKGNRNPVLKSQDATPKLSELGITRDESSRFQQIAAVPQKQFDAHIANARIEQKPVTSASVRSLTKQPDFTPAARAEHERLWRTLRALEQISEQDVTPKQWLASLPDYMIEKVRAHLKRARPWLEKLFKEWESKHE
jgi:hypothetical protein